MFSEDSARRGVTYPRGFVAAGIKAGIKKSGNLDLALIYTKKRRPWPGPLRKIRWPPPRFSMTGR